LRILAKSAGILARFSVHFAMELFRESNVSGSRPKVGWNQAARYQQRNTKCETQNMNDINDQMQLERSAFKPICRNHQPPFVLRQISDDAGKKNVRT
jgi:hypothetical protein